MHSYGETYHHMKLNIIVYNCILYYSLKMYKPYVAEKKLIDVEQLQAMDTNFRLCCTVCIGIHRLARLMSSKNPQCVKNFY